MIFEISGEPMGKQRPKFSSANGFVRTYTPAKTIHYEEWVKLCYQQAGGEYFGEVPLYICVDAYFQIPKAFSKKKRSEAITKQLRPTKKPDADNILKIICDSLNGVAYKDDKQIVWAFIQKHYGAQPKVVVTINKYNTNGLC